MAAGRVPIFVNARAGPGGAGSGDLRRRLKAAVPDAEIIDVAPDALYEAVCRARDDGAAIIGVGGGDGTLNTAASALSGSQAVLLCVPLGTLNNFARRIGIRTIEDAGAALAGADVRTIAIGTVADRVFLNTLTFGEYARIVQIRDRLKRYTGKWPAAVLASWAVLFTLRRISVMLDDGEQQLTRRTAFVWAGLGWGSFPRVHASLERRSSPVLEVAVATASTKRAAAAFVFRVTRDMLRGRGPVRDRDLEVLHTRALTVTAGHHIHGTADGEVVRLPPRVEIAVRDDGLRVLHGPHREGPFADRPKNR